MRGVGAYVFIDMRNVTKGESVIKTEDFTTNYFAILEESFESPPTNGNFYLDKQTGWFHTLESLSADQASQVFPGGSTTIAGQVNHAKFYLESLKSYLNGEPTRTINWQDSWQVHEVDSEVWNRLKRTFRAAYENVKAVLKNKEKWDDDSVCDALAILVHSAYHLGAVRQMVQAVNPSK